MPGLATRHTTGIAVWLTAVSHDDNEPLDVQLALRNNQWLNADGVVAVRVSHLYSHGIGAAELVGMAGLRAAAAVHKRRAVAKVPAITHRCRIPDCRCKRSGELLDVAAIGRGRSYDRSLRL